MIEACDWAAPGGNYIIFTPLLGSRCGTALPRRPVDGERSRAGRYRDPHGPRTSGRRGDVAGRVAGGESARLAVDTTHMVQCVSDMGVDY